MCHHFVQQRIGVAEEAIRMAQLAANEESKSSMGDKYETGRAMAQLEIEKNTAQLLEAKKMQQALHLLPWETLGKHVRNGSLVITDKAHYFLSIGAGKLPVEGVFYFAVSLSSPIGNKLLGLSVGDSIDFNGQKTTILEIQ